MKIEKLYGGIEGFELCIFITEKKSKVNSFNDLIYKVVVLRVHLL
jgi:hypothetical protein